MRNSTFSGFATYSRRRNAPPQKVVVATNSRFDVPIQYGTHSLGTSRPELGRCGRYAPPP